MKKLLIIISILILSLTIFELVKSYAVFETNIDGEKDLEIAAWQIHVNNQDINNETHTFYIDNITYTNEKKEQVNKFAPGVTGEFILEIDPTDTEVSFKYDLKIDMSNNEYEQIKIVNVEGVNDTFLTYQDEYYSRIFTLNEIMEGKKDQIRITFTWINDDQYNESDSILGLNENSSFTFPIMIKFSQYKG